MDNRKPIYIITKLKVKGPILATCLHPSIEKKEVQLLSFRKGCRKKTRTPAHAHNTRFEYRHLNIKWNICYLLGRKKLKH